MPLSGVETHCRNGHEYTEDNTTKRFDKRLDQWFRECVTCKRARWRESNQKRRGMPRRRAGLEPVRKVGMTCKICGRRLMEHGLTESCL